MIIDIYKKVLKTLFKLKIIVSIEGIFFNNLLIGDFMKKFIFSMICIFLFITIESSFSRMIVYVSKSGNGSLEWDDQKSHCPEKGSNCQKYVTLLVYSEATTSGILGGTLITAKFDGMTFSVTGHPVRGNFISVHDGKNYPFQAGDYLNIVTSDEHPSLDGLSFSLDGITTNSNGEFTKFVMIP